VFPLFLSCALSMLAFPSFPTRRSSDLKHVLVNALAYESIPIQEVLGHYRHQVIFERHHLDQSVHADTSAKFLPASRLLPLNQERSEEHTSELQSRFELVCRLLLQRTNT